MQYYVGIVVPMSVNWTKYRLKTHTGNEKDNNAFLSMVV